MKNVCAGLLMVFLAGTALAQMPHRVAVLVNENSPDSKKAANFFAAKHGVPGDNIIYLPLPESIVAGRAECTPEQFRTLIYDPAQKILEERGLAGQVLAWVYSVDFPIRILTSSNDRQQMSIMGLTFTRGIVPDLEMMEKGQVLSPLFAGPTQPDGQKLPTRSFDVFSSILKDKMPLPSMMLGYIGENGTDMAVVLDGIEKGVQARQSGQKHPVYLVQTADKARSGPREWQYADAKSELTLSGGLCEIFTNPPPPQTGLMGIMTGAEKPVPSSFGTFAPGAMAEHLTSWSAEFQKPQTKCTEWLKAGATVTAGMVTEPYNHWVKFPNARFFVHYASGSSAMESFYQSIFSPVQVLLLGDPLSQIMGLPAEIKALGLSKEISSSVDAGFVAEARFPVPVQQVMFSALFDGKQIKAADFSTLIDLPFKEAGDGFHEVRVIAQAPIPVTPGSFRDFPVMMNKKGRSIAITGMTNIAPRQVTFQVASGGEEPPKEFYLLWNGRELDRKPYAADTVLSFHEEIVGEGPSKMQAVAVYEDGMKVRSVPVLFTVAFEPQSE